MFRSSMVLLTRSTIEGFSSSSAQSQFLSNRSQYVVVDGCRSKLVNEVSGTVRSASVKCSGSAIVLLAHREAFL